MTASIEAVPTDVRLNRLQYERFLAATDVDQVRTLLLEESDSGPHTQVSVLDAKLEPGRPAVILYRVGDRLVHGTIPAPDESTTHAPALQISRYPTDPGLAGLPCAESADCLARSLERGHLDGPVNVTRVQTRLLRYRPGRRATFEVSAHVRAGADERGERLVAKVYHDRAKAAAVAREGRELVAQVAAAPLVLARVLAHDPDRAIVTQEHLAGRPLSVDVVAEATPLMREQLAGAAQALAVFHGLTVSNGRARSLERELQRFVTRSAGVLSVDEETGAALLDLAHRLLRLPRPDRDQSLVHGDCKPGQFLVDGARVALLDLDHCGLADPVYDVGNLVASLRQQAIQDSQQAVQDSQSPPERLGMALELGALFLDAYGVAHTSTSARAAGWAGRPAPAQLEKRVEVFVAISLMRKALRAFARDPRSSVPLRLVAEAHRGLDDTGGAHP